MAEVINRTYKKGKLVSETKEEIDWQPNEADLDIILIGCECGNQFDMPWDVLAFSGFIGMRCGQCGEIEKMEVIADPSPNKNSEKCNVS